MAIQLVELSAFRSLPILAYCIYPRVSLVPGDRESEKKYHQRRHSTPSIFMAQEAVISSRQINRMLTVATARSWSRAHRKMPMPIAGNKMCSLLAISGVPSRVTSSPPFLSGRGSQLPSTAVSDESDVDVPVLPPASSGRSGRRSGLVSVALSTDILKTERNHEPAKLPSSNQERVKIGSFNFR